MLSSFMELGKVLEDLMRNHPLFQVTNHHGEACGIPPQIDEQTFPGVYRSSDYMDAIDPGVLALVSRVCFCR